MKIIVTTSNKYLHILPVFCFLFNRYWGSSHQVEIVGYDKPSFNLPPNFSFYSLGPQVGDATNFTRDLRRYFSKQEQHFIWMMEDTFVKAPVNFHVLNVLQRVVHGRKVGRINLCHEVTKQEHSPYLMVEGLQLFKNNPFSLYRLSTQPSIWNRDYVLRYMQADLTPWQFECQSDNQVDRWLVLGLDQASAPLIKNEGVRKRNIHAYDLNGIDETTISEMKTMGIL